MIQKKKQSPYDRQEPFFENYDGMSPPTENRLKPKHKKSRSDNFNVSDKNEDKSSYYNLFLNLQAPKDFLTNITPSNSSRFAKAFNSEKGKDETMYRFPNFTPADTQNQLFVGLNKAKVFDSEKEIPNKPPMFYVGTTPPGLTPKKQNIGGPLKTNNEEELQMFQNKSQFQIPEKVLLYNFLSFLLLNLFQKKLKYFKANEEGMPLYQNKNQFQMPDSVFFLNISLNFS